jgi:hypothetical protein
MDGGLRIGPDGMGFLLEALAGDEVGEEVFKAPGRRLGDRAKRGIVEEMDDGGR